MKNDAVTPGGCRIRSIRTLLLGALLTGCTTTTIINFETGLKIDQLPSDAEPVANQRYISLVAGVVEISKPEEVQCAKKPRFVKMQRDILDNVIHFLVGGIITTRKVTAYCTLKPSAFRNFQKGQAVHKSQPQTALQFYLTALMEEPEYLDALYNAGEVSDTLQKYPEAVKYYEQQLAIQQRLGLSDTLGHAIVARKMGRIYASKLDDPCNGMKWIAAALAYTEKHDPIEARNERKDVLTVENACFQARNLAKIKNTNQLIARNECKKCFLGGIKVDFAKLEKANLEGADLTKAILYFTNLKGANLKGAVLREAILQGADLTGADLTGADLTGADLRKTDFTGAKIDGAIMKDAQFGETVMPNGTKCNSDCAK